jgi:hypothetical protein
MSQIFAASFSVLCDFAPLQETSPIAAAALSVGKGEFPAKAQSLL